MAARNVTLNPDSQASNVKLVRIHKLPWLDQANVRLETDLQMVSYFVLSFFPRDVLDEIWDRGESAPENFPT